MLRLEIIGNLAKDAVVKEANGRKFLTFQVAHNRSFKSADGSTHEHTEWVSCIMNTRFEGVAPYLTKGRKVFCAGEPSARLYAIEKDGAKTFGASIDLVVWEVELCSSAERSQVGAGSMAAAQPSSNGESREKSEDNLPF